MSERALALKAKLRNGGTAVGAFLSLTDPAVAEIMAGAGFDWVWIDTEHAPWGLEQLQTTLMAFNRTQTVPIVRVPWNDHVHIKRALDVGAEGIIAPMVRTPAEAAALVSACRYPPRGTRGFGPRRASSWGRNIEPYMANFDDAVFVIAQIEHVDTANNMDAMLAVPGLDALAIGPNDLSGTAGLMRQHEHPVVKGAIDRIVAAGKTAGLPVTLGITTPPEETAAYAARGVTMVLVASDVGALVKTFDTSAAAARGVTLDGAAIEKAAEV